MASIPIEILDTHIHLSDAHMKALFGEGYKMTVVRPRKNLTGQFIYKETVQASGSSGSVDRVVVMGPGHEHTQLELTEADASKLGIEVPERDAGDLRHAGSCMLKGPNGVVELTEGVIISKAHLHASPDEASRLGLKNGDKAKLCLEKNVQTTFVDVLVRVHPTYKLMFHLPAHEAKSQGVDSGSTAVVVHQ